MLKASLTLYALLGIGMFGLGFLYLTLSEFMPYHAQALQTDWVDLPANYRGFIIGVLRALGAGAAVSGVAIAWMAVASWRNSVVPYRELLPIVSIGYTSLLGWATWTVATRTPGEPPLVLTGVAVVTAVFATILLALSMRE